MEDLMRFLQRCRWLLDPQGVSAAPKQDVKSRRQDRVQNVMNLMLHGFNAALETDAATLTKHLSGMSLIDQSIMYEGAFMALGSIDLAGSANLERVSAVDGFNGAWVKQMFQGLGGAIWKLDIPVAFYPAEVNQSWGWLAISGYGCHGGYFNWPQFIHRQEIPVGMKGLSRKAFDQGIGSSMWFVSGCEPKLILELISKFPEERKADLWNGLGLAIGIWGMEDRKDLIRLLNGAKKYRAQFQAGVGFGVWVRAQAKEVTDYSEGACHTICCASVDYIESSISNQLSDIGGAPKDSIEFLKWKNNVAGIFEHS
ncbi:MAG: DUF1702 family protein [Candidatus Obscuribacterales bacterium]|nr:DUF1702 family protein [Candidatus Obscuribacterales bacterium]